MAKRWSETVADHRTDVREAVLEAAGSLALERGVLSVTMSQIAQEAGIGRATLYRYFDDVGSVLLAWHDRQVRHHLAHLRRVRDGTAGPRDRLRAVLDAYALVSYETRRHRDSDLAALLHRGDRIARVHTELREMVRDLVADAAGAGEVRGDVGPGELAVYCLHALDAARELTSKAAVRRLVEVTLDALAAQEPEAAR